VGTERTVQQSGTGLTWKAAMLCADSTAPAYVPIDRNESNHRARWQLQFDNNYLICIFSGCKIDTTTIAAFWPMNTTVFQQQTIVFTTATPSPSLIQIRHQQQKQSTIRSLLTRDYDECGIIYRIATYSKTADLGKTICLFTILELH